MLNRKMKPIAAAVGAAFVASLAAGAAAETGADPFEANVLEEGTLLAASHKEGGCGEEKGSEGEESEGKCGEGKCGEGEESEGKCGEGKCGEGEESEGEESEGEGSS